MQRGDRDSDQFVNLGDTARATTQVQPSHTAVLVPRYVHHSWSTAGPPPARLPGRDARVDGRPARRCRTAGPARGVGAVAGEGAPLDGGARAGAADRRRPLPGPAAPECPGRAARVARQAPHRRRDRRHRHRAAPRAGDRDGLPGQRPDRDRPGGGGSLRDQPADPNRPPPPRHAAGEPLRPARRPTDAPLRDADRARRPHRLHPGSPHPHAQPAWPRTPAQARVRRHGVGSGAGRRRSGARHLCSRGAHRGRPGCDLPAGARRAGRRAVRLRSWTAHATTITTSSTGRCGSTSRSSSGPFPRSSSPAVADGLRTAEAIGTAPRVPSWPSAAGPRGCGSVGSASSARRSGRLAWNSGTTSACSSADGR